MSFVWATKLFRHDIFGTAYTIYTDHKALLWSMNLKDPLGRVARWSYTLQGNNATIKHRTGKHHQDVDALSRLLQPINSPEISTDLKFEDNNPPDNLTCNSINISNEHHISTKTQDIYKDPHLLHFLKYGTYLPGASNKQNKRVHRAAIHYKCYNNNLFFQKSST